MPYLDDADLSAYLGRDLTAAESAQSAAVIDAASAWVDQYMGRTWAGSAVTGETHTLYGDVVYLDRAPVASVSAVTLTPRWIGATPIALTAGSNYALYDARRGVLLVYSWRHAALVTVDYTTSADSVPADVKLAATILSAQWLSLTGDPNRSSDDIKSYQVGQELQVTFRDAPKGGVDPKVTALLASYAGVVFA